SNTWRGIYAYGNGLNGHSELTTISHNTIVDNIEVGVRLDIFANGTISNNTISGSNIGILVQGGSDSNEISNNNITSNSDAGIRSQAASHENKIFENQITSNDIGVDITALLSTGNYFYHNNFIGNTVHASDVTTNFWDNGYPSGGNYWSDYTGSDVYSGPNQDMPGNDDIGDTPYTNIGGAENQDNYPLWQPSEGQKPLAVAEPNHQDTTVGNLVGFSGNMSFDPDGFIVLYNWDFGDGNTVNGSVVTHTYSISGNYTVTLTVTDNNGLTDTDTCTVTVYGLQAPVAVANPNYQEAIVGETVLFNANMSYDPDGTIVSYSWDFGDTYTGTGINSTHVYTISGSYVVTLTVTDNDGFTDSDTCIVNITGLQPPVAVAESGSQEANVGDTVWFYGNMSYDPDGTIVDYYWDFDDGSTGNGSIISHVYNVSGIYTVTLTVTDNDGLTDTDTCTVTVHGSQAPIAVASPDYQQIMTGESAYFNASLSYDPDGTIISFQWNYGDGHTGSGEFPSHIYTTTGNYTITLTVTDNDGLTDMDTCIVNVIGLQSPVAIVDPDYQEVGIGENATFFGEDSYDPDGVILTYHWDFGDGQNITVASDDHVNHSYTVSGNYTVTLTVTDNDGFNDTDTCLVRVIGLQAPVAVAAPDTQGIMVGEIAYFSGNQSYDNDGTITNYYWNFGDGRTGTGIIADHSYSTSGFYTVMLTVRDNDGLIGTTYCSVNVTGLSIPVAIIEP
ncbi:MAG: PKD domain-containing protein, partial [Thermoplasmata archaeon]|nr:PKD domain-containing protein [Thermoplasmata archaeon]